MSAAGDVAEIVGKLLVSVVAPILRGDVAELRKKRVEEILGNELMTSAAKRAADARARERLGGPP